MPLRLLEMQAEGERLTVSLRDTVRGAVGEGVRESVGEVEGVMEVEELRLPLRVAEGQCDTEGVRVPPAAPPLVAEGEREADCVTEALLERLGVNEWEGEGVALAHGESEGEREAEGVREGKGVAV